ncbi:hypothetical protein CVT26_009549 [Gymnopilus dilepis]|uniref:Uncharacterized protein n=1 Tax=Gymnopilus dilepis TaxID=231916 RepID=A0A409VK90_9AGAR|nr:hypothetical protein CVT26_009549 [Gymnopilus dilepis]
MAAPLYHSERPDLIVSMLRETSLSPEPPFVLENELNDFVDFERSDLSENGDSYDTDEEENRSLARPVPNDGYELSIYQGIQTHTLHAPCILTFVPYPDEPDFCRTLIISRDGSIDIRDGELSVDERDNFFASPVNQGQDSFSLELSRDNFTLFAEPAWKVKARRRQRQRNQRPQRPNHFGHVASVLSQYSSKLLPERRPRSSAQRSAKSTLLGVGQSRTAFKHPCVNDKSLYPYYTYESPPPPYSLHAPSNMTSGVVEDGLEKLVALRDWVYTLPAKLQTLLVKAVEDLEVACEDCPLPGTLAVTPIIGVKRNRDEFEDMVDRLALEKEERPVKKLRGRRYASLPPGL